nr:MULTISPECIES: hypothetical protein [Enterobacteriaceae]
MLLTFITIREGLQRDEEGRVAIPYLTHYLTQIASKEKGVRRFII